MNYFEVFCANWRDQKSLSRECIASNMVIIKPQVDTAIGTHCSLLGTALYQTVFSFLEEHTASLFKSKGNSKSL
jgi:hypothetical protein